jgi:uncharacterized protein
MARHPLPGQVKTRLANRIGDAAACALHAAFISDLASRLRTFPCPTAWAYWPPDAPFPPLVGGGDCFPQQGHDLGERLASAIERCLASAPGVVAIGADVPHVPESAVADAAHHLAVGTDLVLGPARDGGYYLVGLGAPHRALFESIPWGTERVLGATLDRARELGLRTTLVEETFDIDELEDLADLRTALRTGTITLEHTAALLETMAEANARPLGRRP